MDDFGENYHQHIKDWSLTTGRWGATKREGGGGYLKFYPYRDGGAEGDTKSVGVVFIQ